MVTSEVPPAELPAAYDDEAEGPEPQLHAQGGTAGR